MYGQVSCTQVQLTYVQQTYWKTFSQLAPPIIASESIEPKQVPIDSTWLAKSQNTFPLHMKVNCALHKNWANLDKVFIPSKLFSVFFPIKKYLKKKVGPAIAVLSKHLSILVEDVSSFKDSVSRCFETLFKAHLAFVGPALQADIADMST